MKSKYLALLLILLSLGSTRVFAQCVIPISSGQSYTENFDSGTMECWTVETTGTATWAVMAGTATNVAAFQNATTGSEARLISPTFDMSGASSATFSFGYAMMGLYPPYDVLTVSYRTSVTDSWHVIGIYDSPADDWETVTLALPEASAEYQIGFDGLSNNGDGVYVDDVWVGNDPTVSIEETDEITDGEAVVYDLFGRKVATTVFHNGLTNLDGVDLAKGVYVVRISNDHGIKTMKIIKE